MRQRHLTLLRQRDPGADHRRAHGLYLCLVQVRRGVGHRNVDRPGEGDTARRERKRDRCYGRSPVEFGRYDPEVVQVACVERHPLDTVVREVGSDVHAAVAALGAAGEADGVSFGLHLMVGEPAVLSVSPVDPRVVIRQTCSGFLPALGRLACHLHPDEPVSGAEPDIDDPAGTGPQVCVRDLDAVMLLSFEPVPDRLPDV